MRLIRSIASAIVLAQLVLGQGAAQSCEHSPASDASVPHHTQHSGEQGPANAPTCDHVIAAECAASASCSVVLSTTRSDIAREMYEQGVTPDGELLAHAEHLQRPEPPPPRI